MSLNKLKKKIEEQRGRKAGGTVVDTSGVATRTKRTPTLNKEVSSEDVVDTGTRKGYYALGKNDTEELFALKDAIIRAGFCSLDYETNGDLEEEHQDPQDHSVVGVSVAHTVGTSVYLPVAHVNYSANWDKQWLVENFLKPILEHPEVTVIAHNIKFEHQMSVLMGIDMFPKTVLRKVMDTMLLVKGLALNETVISTSDGYEVAIGLKPSAKALLADRNGMIHNIIHVDDVKSFKDTVGKIEWEEPTGEFYTLGKNKGLPKTIKKTRTRTFDELAVDKHSIEYACSDADWALGLYRKLIPIAEDEGVLDVIYELDVPFLMTLGEIELAGWHVNPERLESMRAVAEIALQGDKSASEGSDEWLGIEARLHQALIKVTEGYADIDESGNVIVPSGVYGMGEWRGESVALEIKASAPFNWQSNNHKPWLFFHVLGVSTEGLERSKKTGIVGTGKENLDKIIDSYEGDNTFMKLLKEKLKYDKILSTYVEGLLPYVRKDTNKIHTNLNLVSTWRLSSKKPNLQNIPRPDNDPMGIRGVFEAPFYDTEADYSHLNLFTRPVPMINLNKLSGHTFFIGSDYSQIELKVLAWYAREKSMIATLANGGDLHSVVAHEVFKLRCAVEEVKKLYKSHRYRAKKVNFGIVYGMTEFGLSKDPQMGMSQSEARTFIENYYKTYPGIRTYAHEQIAFARKNGYVSTMFGHRRPIPEINDPNEWVRKKGENKAMNTPIQGSASDIIRMAMVNIRRRAVTEAPYVKQVMQIHDEIQVEVPVEYASEGAKFVKMVMEQEIDGFSDIMPIIAEPAVGKVWQHALDITWDKDGTPYVKPKSEKREATDVAYEDIEYALPLYRLAGIEVR